MHPDRRLHLLCGLILLNLLLAHNSKGNPDHNNFSDASDYTQLSATVRLQITPGKPSAPSERISLHKTGDRYRITVERKLSNDSIVQGEAPVTATEFQQAWNIVQSEKLQTFVPRVETGKSYDFGERMLFIQWKSSDQTEYQQHEAGWTHSLKNNAAIQPLQTLLGQLAARHVPDTPLYYFPK